ncbi:flagellar protein [Paraliobacillus quinghaiensis]|uniref:Flagellar protein n=1 Tax=Paraliobacillus quinghaiensis TaxID=470815 RepID=A0A917TFV4_9BACI|nr:TIGR02530 family flagellar biosynthesis protein [Paraliobacillus quinghaiensis]GGM21425.1 flagellar protein [Paraliobacillus quinghaiensis]
MDHRIQQLHQGALLPKRKVAQPVKTNTSFQDILTNVQSLKVSKHAQARLTERNIKIDDAKWQQISEKVVEAKQKGITDSLVVTDEATLLVSTKNNTVVTAMDRKEAQSRIFTNINGTIVVD